MTSAAAASREVGTRRTLALAKGRRWSAYSSTAAISTRRARRFPTRRRRGSTSRPGSIPSPIPSRALDPAAWTRLPSPAEIAGLQQRRGGALRRGSRAGRRGARHAGADPVAAAPVPAPPPSPSPARPTAATRRRGAPPAPRCWSAPRGRCAPSWSSTPTIPTGGAGRSRTLRARWRRARRLLVVDEAFADFDGRDAGRRSAAANAWCCARSARPMGLAGLRLGFAIARPQIAATLRAALGAWAVSGPALEIGRRALADAAWLADARDAAGGGRGAGSTRFCARGVRDRRRHRAVPPRPPRRRARGLRGAGRAGRADAPVPRPPRLAALRPAASGRQGSRRGGAPGPRVALGGTLLSVSR